MNKFLFIFTIGPVQSFISQARKTQDLYAGSFLLSELTRRAIREIETRDAEIIYPNLHNRSLPNRFVALLPCESLNAAEEIGVETEKTLRSYFNQLHEESMKKIKGQIPISSHSQIETLLDIHWACILFNEDYFQTYNNLESSLGAIKGIRTFKQNTETGRKCSICGERNSIFFRKRPDTPKWQPRYNSPVALGFENISLSELKPGESLCAICFFKRRVDHCSFKEYDPEYPSVSFIALQDCLFELRTNDEGSVLMESYKKLFKNQFDSELLYEESLTNNYLEKNGFLGVDLEKVRESRKKIHDWLKKRGRKLSKYYAVVAADGDNMGRWVSGCYLDKPEDLYEFHKKLTNELGNYAEHLHSILANPKGKVVYAGGDDVLAFMNVSHLLSTLSEIRNHFPMLEDMGFTMKNGTKSTLSAGICIAHYKTPLTEVVRFAKEMEDKAKQQCGKDAFAIAILKRSGQIYSTVQQWKNDSIRPLDCLQKVVTKLLDNSFSNAFIRHLEQELAPIINQTSEKIEDTIREITKTEIERLVKRASKMKQDENEQVDEFLVRKKKVISSLVSTLHHLLESSTTFDRFTSLLDICMFLAKEVNAEC